MDRLMSTFNAIVLACCAAAATAGLVGLLGWVFGAPGVASLLPGLTVINPLTALCLIALSIALGLQRAPGPSVRPLARALAVLVGLAGLAVLGDHLLGWQLGLDQVLFREQLRAVVPPDGMATATAIAFVLLGAGMTLLDVEGDTRVTPSQVLALAAAVVSLQSLMAYTYSVFRLIDPMQRPMALLAAVGLFALSLGLVCARPLHGLMREVASPLAGGRIIRRFTPAWLGLPFLLAPIDLLFRRHGHLDGYTMPQVELTVLAIGLTYWVGTSLNREDEARSALEQQREDAERAMREILSRTFDIVAIFEDDRMTYLNEAGLRALGIARQEEVADVPLLSFLAPERRETSAERLAKVLEGQEVPVIETTLVRPDGRPLDVEVTSMRVLRHGRPAIQVVGRDITERRRRETLLQAERDILEQIAGGTELETTLRAITRLVESQAQAMLATILLVADQRVHVAAADSLPGWYNQSVEGQPIGPKAGSCGTAIYRRQTVVTPDIATDPLWDDYRAVALKAGLAASWSTPLFSSDGRVLGTLAYYYHVPQDPTPKDMRLADVARHLAEIAIERTQSDRALRQARQELEQRVAERTEQLQRDIAEREQTEARLRTRERLLSEAQSLAHMGAWEWDMVQNEVHWSDELYRIYGLTPQSFGATFEAFLGQIREDDREYVRGVIQNAAQHHTPYAIEEHIIRPDGEERILASSGRVDVDAAGQAVRMWGICLDISERKRAEAEVHQLNATLERRIAERTAQLEAANQELEAFSYSVSHDLRAPLRSIDGFSQALLEDYQAQLDETGKDYLRRVRAASQRMAQLIDDILQLSRLTRGEMRWSRVDLSALAREVNEEVREQSPDRAVEFTVADGLTARGDARLLKAALENLIGNAWKFTSHHPTAHIEVGVTTRQGERLFFVKDDGAGFEMAYVDKLFKPFSRLHNMDEFPGTGIGLATVQRIVHRHGGRIWAEGAVEQGATLYFTLQEGDA